MEMVAKMCEECMHYINAGCEGRPQAGLKVGKLPCKKYQLYTGEDLDSTPDAVEPEPEPSLVVESEPEPSLVVESEPEPIEPPTPRKNVKGGAKSVDVRKANFQRLSTARVNKAIAAIKLLGNLNNVYAYAFEPTDIQALRTMLENTISDVFSQL